MMQTRIKISVDAYMAALPVDVRAEVAVLRALLRRLVPGGTEAIRYGMPTIRVHDRNLVHFAAMKKHIGFYPTPSGVAAFAHELDGKYVYSKGAIQLPLGKRLPTGLITRIVRYRLREESAHAKK